MKYFISQPLEGPGEPLTSPSMGPQTGTLTDLGAKSYAPLNLGASGKGGAWTTGGQGP